MSFSASQIKWINLKRTDFLSPTGVLDKEEMPKGEEVRNYVIRKQCVFYIDVTILMHVLLTPSK